jgi:hypothetical protein
MPDGKAVERLTMHLPIGHEPVHQSVEPFVMRRLQEVDNLVDEDGLQAFWRLLGELGIEPNAPRFRIAATFQEPLPIAEQG